MKKSILAAVSTLAVAAALPAMAEVTFSGLFRTNMITELGTLTNEGTPDTYGDTRLRPRVENKLNDYLSVVWFGEIDVVWGEFVGKPAGAANAAGAGGLGSGGKLGGDGVNVETKQVYADVKVPNLPVAARVGLQGFADQGMSAAVFLDDMTGVKLDVKAGPVPLTLGYFKFDEGQGRSREDDNDFYAAQANLAVGPVKLMPQLYYNVKKAVTPMRGTNEYATDTNWYPGVAASWAGPVNVSGFLVFDVGTAEDADTSTAGKRKDQDISAFALSAKVDAPVGPAKVGARVMLYSADDDKKADNSFNSIGGTRVEYMEEGLSIFLFDALTLNGYGGRQALTDAAYAGYGLLGLVANASFTPPAVKDLTLKAALGYFQSLDDRRDGSKNVVANGREGLILGTEFALSANYKIGEKADLTLRGAYAFLGDFYDKSVNRADDSAGANTKAKGEDPDNLYKLALTLSIPF